MIRVNDTSINRITRYDNHMNDSIVLDSITTHRGTTVEMTQRPHWGMSCYMDQQIQSCERDEKIYHEALVHPSMSSVSCPKRVMIIGGGEGATAREVLKWPAVEHVDMYEWDKDIVQLFRTRYPQWANGAWSDPRLTLHYDDIFEAIQTPPSERYDVVIIDLFDPSEDTYDSWAILLRNLSNWVTPTGTVAMYAGIRTVLSEEQPHHVLTRILMEPAENGVLQYREIIPYHLYIPSFEGDSMFLLLCQPLFFYITKTIDSHLTDSLWKSYQVFDSQSESSRE